jgi:hypothetical protein
MSWTIFPSGCHGTNHSLKSFRRVRLIVKRDGNPAENGKEIDI